MGEEVACIRGRASANVDELLSEEGRGKMLLGERRTPKEELLDTVAEMISERLPDIPVYKVGDGFLPDIRSAVSSGEGHMAILVYGPRFYSSESEYVDSLPEDILVFCTQELCHQVPAVFRMHRILLSAYRETTIHEGDMVRGRLLLGHGETHVRHPGRRLHRGRICQRGSLPGPELRRSMPPHHRIPRDRTCPIRPGGGQHRLPGLCVLFLDRPLHGERTGERPRTQYQACIFWRDPETEDTVRRISAVEAMRYRPFCVVLEELKVFRRAEEYHQRYLEKNEHGYCHVDPYLIKQVSDRVFDPSAYKRPSDEEISESLSGSEIYITQNGGTEPPFDNEYDSEFGRGIFVDKVTGEPLFLSQDKYNSHCGWPAFSRPLDPNAMVYLEDRSLPITRIEVRSRVGNTHLGHVFYGDSWSPTRARYCMNSASLRFIPVEDMETEGYGHLVHLVGEKKEMWRSPFSDDVGRI